MRLLAHRGGRGFGLDNTLEAMTEAVRHGVRWLEIDVRTTEDGQLVVCHDSMIWNRIVKRTTYEELQRTDPARPLLSEVMEELAGWVRFDLDIKDAPAGAVGELLETYGVGGETLVSSFHAEFLESFHRLYPDTMVGLLYRMAFGRDRKLAAALSAGCEVLLPHFHSVDEELVEEAHRLGLEVWAWTVNDTDDLRKLFGWGVDGVITDRYPEMADLLRNSV